MKYDGVNMDKRKREYGIMTAVMALAVIMLLWMGLIRTAGPDLPAENHAAIQTEPSDRLPGEKPEQDVKPTVEQLSLHAMAAVLMDGDSGRILYGKNENQIRPMASTTKIMTCILALENGNLSDVCTVSRHASGQPKVHLGAPEGTQFLLKDLLYSLMLESHNDTAVVIAEHIAGSVEGFAEMMNQKARDLGCRDTWFVTPNGLDASALMADGTERDHSTTAADLARIMRYCIQESPAREQFLEITGTPSWYFQDISGKMSFSCSNHNALLTMVDGAVSGKTGFTSGAGYSYVGAVEDEGRQFVIAILGCGWPPHKSYKWEDAQVLLRHGAEHFHYQNVYEEPELGYLAVEHGIPGVYEPETGAEQRNGDQFEPEQAYVKLITMLDEEEKMFPFLMADSEKIQIKAELPVSVQAPVAKGELVGTIRYELNGKTIRLEPVYTAAKVPELGISYFFLYILKKFSMES